MADHECYGRIRSLAFSSMTSTDGAIRVEYMEPGGYRCVWIIKDAQVARRLACNGDSVSEQELPLSRWSQLERIIANARINDDASFAVTGLWDGASYFVSTLVGTTVKQFVLYDLDHELWGRASQKNRPDVAQRARQRAIITAVLVGSAGVADEAAGRFVRSRFGRDVAVASDRETALVFGDFNGDGLEDMGAVLRVPGGSWRPPENVRLEKIDESAASAPSNRAESVSDARDTAKLDTTVTTTRDIVLGIVNGGRDRSSVRNPPGDYLLLGIGDDSLEVYSEGPFRREGPSTTDHGSSSMPSSPGIVLTGRVHKARVVYWDGSRYRVGGT
jgi:hypothetical protein